jgi:hypothetical protein
LNTVYVYTLNVSNVLFFEQFPVLSLSMALADASAHIHLFTL